MSRNSPSDPALASLWEISTLWGSIVWGEYHVGKANALFAIDIASDNPVPVVLASGFASATVEGATGPSLDEQN